MAVEARRGCGYRKIGGTYLVTGPEGTPCGRFPIPLTVCPACGGGIKQTRGWTWIKPDPILVDAPSCKIEVRRLRDAPCLTCPMGDPRALGERIGLLWIGRKFYATPEDFLHESSSMGISRRITAIPRGFKVGETWVAFAHPAAVAEHIYQDASGNEPSPLIETKFSAGIIYLTKPPRIERILGESSKADTELLADLAEKGITPVFVPDDDKDHQGSVYDDEEENGNGLLH